MKRANFLCVKIITGKPELYTIEKLKSAAIKQGLETQIINPFQGVMDLTPDTHENLENTLVIPRVSGTSLDDLDLIYCHGQKSAGATIVNDPDLSLKIRNKTSQYLHLNSLGIASFKTWAPRGDFEAPQFNSPLVYPEQWVLKTFRGNKGKGVSLIKGRDSLRSIWETFCALGDQRFILQPRYRIDAEWRILVLPKSADKKERIVGGLLKKLKNDNGEDFRLNAERIEASFHESLPTDVLAIVKKIIEKVPFDIMGIDLAQCQGELMVCEINPTPGFEFFDQIAKKDIGSEIINQLLNS